MNYILFCLLHVVPPQLQCEPAEAMIGDEVSLTCTTTMNPTFTYAKWSWINADIENPGESSADGNYHSLDNVRPLCKLESVFFIDI